MKQSLGQKLRDLAPDGYVLEEEPLGRHTSFRIGGPAEFLVSPSHAEEACRIYSFLASSGTPAAVLGLGTNVLAPDAGLRGVVIRLGSNLAALARAPDAAEIKAEAGATLASVSTLAAAEGLGGMEFAAGIPGAVGGALVLNAGAYGGEIGNFVESVTVAGPDGSTRELVRGDLSFGYRSSSLGDLRGIILKARFGGNFSRVSPEHARGKIRELARKRREMQPLDKPSAGSIFKKAAGRSAGWYIEQAGLKGARIGGCEISSLHANFIVNSENGRAEDVLALIDLAREKIRLRFGIELEREIRLLETGLLAGSDE